MRFEMRLALQRHLARVGRSQSQPLHLEAAQGLRHRTKRGDDANPARLLQLRQQRGLSLAAEMIARRGMGDDDNAWVHYREQLDGVGKMVDHYLVALALAVER